MADIGDSLTSERLKSVHAAWKELAGGKIGPRREEMTPARLRGAMPWTYLIEVQPNDFRFSFSGERIQQFMGTRLAGQQLSSLPRSAYYEGMNRLFRRCAEQKRPLHALPHRSTYPGKEHFEIEVILLPLSEDGATVNYLLGAFDTWQAGTHTSGG